MHKMNEMEMREKLVDYGKRLVAAGLVQGNLGETFPCVFLRKLCWLRLRA